MCSRTPLLCNCLVVFGKPAIICTSLQSLTITSGIATTNPPSMSTRSEDQRKRPPPINIPALPLPRPRPAPRLTPNFSQRLPIQQQQRDVGQDPQVAQQGPQSTGTSPLTSPLEPEVFPLPKSGSSRSCTSGKSAFASLIDASRRSPRKSDHGSATASVHDAASREHHGATPQAQPELFDVRSVRGRIESRTEQQTLKKTGLMQSNGMFYVIYTQEL